MSDVKIPDICCNDARIIGDGLWCMKFANGEKVMEMNPKNPPCHLCIFNKNNKVPKSYKFQELLYSIIKVKDFRKDSGFVERMDALLEVEIDE